MTAATTPPSTDQATGLKTALIGLIHAPNGCAGDGCGCWKYRPRWPHASPPIVALERRSAPYVPNRADRRKRK